MTSNIVQFVELLMLQLIVYFFTFVNRTGWENDEPIKKEEFVVCQNLPSVWFRKTLYILWIKGAPKRRVMIGKLLSFLYDI